MKTNSPVIFVTAVKRPNAHAKTRRSDTRAPLRLSGQRIRVARRLELIVRVRIGDETMNIKEIIERHIKETGQDGLYNADAECACELADLMPCGGDISTCAPGYRHSCDCGEDCNFHMKEYAEADH